MKNSEFCYCYDGSLNGLLTLVFDSFYLKEIPLRVESTDSIHTLLPIRNIISDSVKAQRVIKAVEEKIGAESSNNVKMTLLAEFPDKEIALIRYLLKGFEVGGKVNSFFSDDAVGPFLKGIRALHKEKMRFIEFLRFSDYNGKLFAEFEPEHYSLPLIAQHFVLRFPNEIFSIFDKTHNLAFIYIEKTGKIIPAEQFHLPELSEEEKKFRTLWKTFYNAVAIESRKNERLRMQHMPKKFCKQVTEFLD